MLDEFDRPASLPAGREREPSRSERLDRLVKRGEEHVERLRRGLTDILDARDELVAAGAVAPSEKIEITYDEYEKAGDAYDALEQAATTDDDERIEQLSTALNVQIDHVDELFAALREDPGIADRLRARDEAEMLAFAQASAPGQGASAQEPGGSASRENGSSPEISQPVEALTSPEAVAEMAAPTSLLYTSMDINDFKTHDSVTRSAADHGVQLRSFQKEKGGWQFFGAIAKEDLSPAEIELYLGFLDEVNSKTRGEGGYEGLALLPLPDSRVRVCYGYGNRGVPGKPFDPSQFGYSFPDATGRPGNTVVLSFIVTGEVAEGMIHSMRLPDGAGRLIGPQGDQNPDYIRRVVREVECRLGLSDDTLSSMARGVLPHYGTIPGRPDVVPEEYRTQYRLDVVRSDPAQATGP